MAHKWGQGETVLHGSDRVWVRARLPDSPDGHHRYQVVNDNGRHTTWSEVEEHELRARKGVPDGDRPV